MRKIRLWYEKTGRARYISHLDMNRCMQRAIKRAGVPAWHTEGFNPHIYLTFALPLSLGHESLCEIMDFKTESDMSCQEMVERLNRNLPEGIRAVRAAEAAQKPEAITWAKYILRLKREGTSADELAGRFAGFWGREKVTVIKKTKKRETELDLKALLTVSGEREEDGWFCFDLLAPAGNTLTVNPSLLTEAFFATFPGEYPVAQAMRTACLTAEMKDFA